MDGRDEAVQRKIKVALAMTDRLTKLRETEVFRFLLTCDVGFLEDLVERFDDDRTWARPRRLAQRVGRMSCRACDEATDGAETPQPPQYFVRIGNANVRIVGCSQHVEELIRRLRFFHEAPTSTVL